MTWPPLIRFASRTDSSGPADFSSEFTSCAAGLALPISLRRSPSLAFNWAVSAARSCANDLIDEPWSACVFRTFRESSIKEIVSGSASDADSISSFPESTRRLRFGPVPANALPNSSTVTCRSSLPTEFTRRSRLRTRSVVGSGTRVLSRGIVLPSSRYGPWDVRGCRSTYCSPTAERFATTASVSAGMCGAPSSMSRATETPSPSVKCRAATLPTGTPRYVTSAPGKIPPESAKSARTV